ncbi:hypothetical protein BC937DRAFT_94288 [Endogone sp. FLAS-F59071]|nr:hypothetical protein BC937DRAFT_94288 [Endogone sp. FLAS-F59071]|eukprot:RUS20823.1 hypothetical protein BC937DRAFT_94288 [Endogone sp. FLAS-F59071]
MTRSKYINILNCVGVNQGFGGITTAGVESTPRARPWIYWGWKIESLYNATYVDFPSLLTTSDIININVPLTSDTHKLVGAKEYDEGWSSGSEHGSRKDYRRGGAGGGIGEWEGTACGLKRGRKSIRGSSNPHPAHWRRDGGDGDRDGGRNVDHVLSTGKFITPVPEHQGYF